MSRLAAAASAVARFWYGFIVGDDWRVAASVLAALVATYLLLRVNLAAWWLVPLAVIASVAANLARTGAAR